MNRKNILSLVIIAAGIIFIVILAVSLKKKIGQGAPDSSSSTSSGSAAFSSSPPSSSARSSIPQAAGGTDLLMLVNKTHLIPDGFQPALAKIDIRYYYSTSKDNRFNAAAASFLVKMLNAAEADGIRLLIVSGYRTHDFQVENYRNKVNKYLKLGYTKEKAEQAAANEVAPPGTSEHETGLSADIVNAGWYSTHSELTADFDQTEAFRWLNTHAADYGFILRYPKGKESVTQYTYEPWHYRFVGAENARKISRSGLCLEEYLAASGR